MKKLVFSALACVAFAGSSFASNEIVKDESKNQSVEINDKVEDGCTILVVGVDGEGNSKSFVREGSGGLGDCLIAAGHLVLEAEAQGYTVHADAVFIEMH